MTAWLIYALDLSATLIVSVVVVTYINPPLRRLLAEVCGDGQRSEFWAVFANVLLVLTPIIFAMTVDPSLGFGSLGEVVQQIKWGLSGLVISVLVMGWSISRFIPKRGESGGR